MLEQIANTNSILKKTLIINEEEEFISELLKNSFHKKFLTKGWSCIKYIPNVVAAILLTRWLQ